MPSLEEIAQELNVSASLVSKVLNNRLGTTRVGAKTRAAIHARASSTHYRRNASAAALATGKQHAIGVFVHRAGAPGSAIAEEMVEGIADEAALRDQRLLLRFYGEHAQFQLRSGLIQANVIDGGILGGLGHRELAADLGSIVKQGLPIVTVHEDPLSRELPNVGSDQKTVGQMATAHLIEQGCRRIAHIRVHERRFLGYQAALASAGMPYRPELVFAADGYLYEMGERAACHFAASGIAYDGLFAPSDQSAAGALNHLIRMGRRVPEDVKIIGVDNSPLCDVTIVPLSSISQEDRKRGKVAVGLLLDRISGCQSSSIQVPPVLVSRRSTGDWR